MYRNLFSIISLFLDLSSFCWGTMRLSCILCVFVQLHEVFYLCSHFTVLLILYSPKVFADLVVLMCLMHNNSCIYINILLLMGFLFSFFFLSFRLRGQRRLVLLASMVSAKCLLFLFCLLAHSLRINPASRMLFLNLIN